MGKNKINLFNHYRKLFFFLINRFKGDNYRLMQAYFADVMLAEVEEFINIKNKRILDIGGGSGVFCQVLAQKRRCNAINLDPNPGNSPWEKTIKGYAEKIPFKKNCFDFVIFRGVLEHINPLRHQVVLNEIYRVTKKGGCCYLLVPMWYNFHAGHHLTPFHLFPFRIAKYLRELLFKNKIQGNSLAEEGLFPTTYNRTSEMISLSKFKIIATKDTHFRLHFMTKIPYLRDVFVPDVAFILQK